MAWKYLITGLMSTPVDIPIGQQDDFFFSDPLFDFMEGTYDLLGFDLKIPYADIPEPFAGGSEYFMDDTSSLRATFENSQTNLDSATGLSVNDELWIEQELVKVTGIVGTVITLDRGLNNTFPQNYFPDDSVGRRYRFTENPVSLVGLRVFIYWDNIMVTVGIITEQPKTEGDIVTLECSNVLSSLEWDVPQPAGKWHENFYQRSLFLSILNEKYLKSGSLGGEDNPFIGKIPPLADICYYPIPDEGYDGGGKTVAAFPPDKFKTFADFFKFYYILSSRFLAWDTGLQKFNFNMITESTAIDVPIEVTIKDYQDAESVYMCEQMKGINQVTLKLPDQTFTYNLTAIGGEAVEIDLSDVVNADISNALQMANQIIRIWGITYSRLIIPSHSFYAAEFRVGRFYKILDIGIFDTFQSVSDLAYYVGTDQNSMHFIIIRDEIKNIVCSGVPVQTSSTGTEIYFGHASETFEIVDFLDTPFDDAMTTAKRNDLDQTLYFEKSDVIDIEYVSSSLTTSSSTIIKNFTIDSVTTSTDSFTLGTASATAALSSNTDFWMFFGDKNQVTSAGSEHQKDWMYWGIEEW